MAQRLLSNVFSGFLAGASGGLAGEQAGKDRALQLAEMKRRQAMQDEDQAMQRFQFGANLERQGIEDQLSGDELALKYSSPDAEGYGDLFDKAQAHRQQVLGQRQFTPQNFPFIRNGMQPLPNAIPGQGQPQPIPNATPGMGQPQPTPNAVPSQARPTGVLRPVRLDPKIERKRQSFLSGAESYRKALETTNLPKSQEIQQIIDQVASKEKTPEEGHAALAPILAGEQTRFQQTEASRLKRDEAEEARRAQDFDLRKKTFEAGLKADEEAAKAKAFKEKSDRLLKMDDDLSAELKAARATGDFGQILKSGAKRAKFRASNKDVFGSIDDLYSPEPREIVEMGPVSQGYSSKTTVGPVGIKTQGVPGAVEMGPLRRKETDAEIRLRIAKQAEEDAATSEEALSAVKEGLKNTWALITNPKATKATRDAAWADLESYNKTHPQLRSMFPSKKPDMSAMTPEEQQRMDLEWLKFTQGLEDDKRKAQSHSLTMRKMEMDFQKDVQSYKKTEQEMKSKGKPISEYDKDRLDEKRRDAEAIRKTIGVLEGKNPTEYPTKNAELDSYRSAYDAAVKDYRKLRDDVLGPSANDPGKRAANDAIAIAEKKWKMKFGPGARLPEDKRNAISQAARKTAGYAFPQ